MISKFEVILSAGMASLFVVAECPPSRKVSASSVRPWQLCCSTPITPPSLQRRRGLQHPQRCGERRWRRPHLLRDQRVASPPRVRQRRRQRTSNGSTNGRKQ